MAAQEVMARRRAKVAWNRLWLPALVMLAIAASALLHAPAMAQEQGWSLRDLLFPRRSERVQPMKKFPPPPKAKKRTVKKPATTAPEPPPPVVEKAPDARVVLVIGDFLAAGLAEGLGDAFAENPHVRVVDRSNGSSGFVRDDYYDWPGEARAVIEAEKPAVIVAMLGSNDRQQMKVGDVSEAPRTEGWSKQYDARTQAFGKAMADSKVPFLWVGMPAFKSSKMTADMLAFNDVYRSAAQKNGGEFIDIWDGFTDENGAFVSAGPDINGQQARLRADDGINMTRAGKRKIAFYAEKPLTKILVLATPEGAGSGAAHAPAGEPAREPEAGAAPAAVYRTVPMLLSDPALDGGSELLGATTARRGSGAPDGKAAVIDLSPAEPGRADDFSWPQKPAAAKDVTGATTP